MLRAKTCSADDLKYPRQQMDDCESETEKKYRSTKLINHVNDSLGANSARYLERIYSIFIMIFGKMEKNSWICSPYVAFGTFKQTTRVTRYSTWLRG